MYRFGFVPISKRKRVVRDMLWALVNWDNGSFISVRGLKWSAPIGKQWFCEWFFPKKQLQNKFLLCFEMKWFLLLLPDWRSFAAAPADNSFPRTKWMCFEDDFETWSLEDSPSRTPEYMLGGHNPLKPRMSSGWNYEPERLRHRHRNSSGYRDHNNKYGKRRWRDRRWWGLCRCVLQKALTA